jgi:hypothetical protein
MGDGDVQAAESGGVGPIGAFSIRRASPNTRVHVTTEIDGFTDPSSLDATLPEAGVPYIVSPVLRYHYTRLAPRVSSTRRPPCRGQGEHRPPTENDGQGCAALHLAVTREADGGKDQRPDQEDIQRGSQAVEKRRIRWIHEIARIRGHGVLKRERIDIAARQQRYDGENRL